MKRRATLLLIHILFTSFVNGFIHIMPFTKSKFPDLRNIVVEKPNSDFDGTNMKYDKLQNIYTSLYKKLIHNISTTL
jgi:hypothetical protein